MALYVTRPRRDEVRIGRGLPSGRRITAVAKQDAEVATPTKRSCCNNDDTSIRRTESKIHRHRDLKIYLSKKIALQLIYRQYSFSCTGNTVRIFVLGSFITSNVHVFSYRIPSEYCNVYMSKIGWKQLARLSS